jgi:hypothetical protein
MRAEVTADVTRCHTNLENMGSVQFVGLRPRRRALRWSSAAVAPPKEIVRQQWNFSPSGSTTEVEDYSIPAS